MTATEQGSQPDLLQLNKRKGLQDAAGLQEMGLPMLSSTIFLPGLIKWSMPSWLGDGESVTVSVGRV